MLGPHRINITDSQEAYDTECSVISHMYEGRDYAMTIAFLLASSYGEKACIRGNEKVLQRIVKQLKERGS